MRKPTVRVSKRWTLPPIVIVLGFNILLERERPRMTWANPFSDLISSQWDFVWSRIQHCVADRALARTVEELLTDEAADYPRAITHPVHFLALVSSITIRAMLTESAIAQRTRGLRLPNSSDSTFASLTAAVRPATRATVPDDRSGATVAEMGARKQSPVRY